VIKSIDYLDEFGADLRGAQDDKYITDNEDED